MIFDISLAKTGTTSLSKALSILGFNSCHGCPKKYESDTIAKLLQNDMNLDLMKEFDAICGLLNFAYYQLEKTYPNAKFIFLDRDESSWAKSTIRQLALFDNSKIKDSFKMTLFHYTRMQNINCIHTNDIEFITRTFVQRKKSVLEYFSDTKADKLLVMSISDGWRPLCHFLNRDIPNVSFPKVNVSKTKFI